MVERHLRQHVASSLYDLTVTHSLSSGLYILSAEQHAAEGSTLRFGALLSDSPLYESPPHNQLMENQIASAVGEGAMVVKLVHEWLAHTSG